jgi:hypothetical protein
VNLGDVRLAWRAWRYDESYLRAAHYFGDGWPVNCWSDMSLAGARRDFRQMKEDGFNTVILVVPWRGFQIDQFPPRYEAQYLKLLKSLFAVARRAGLLVILRVSYAHHICDEASLTSQQLTHKLLTDGRFLSPWLDYLSRLRGIARFSDNYYGAFLCWEEFWHVLMSYCAETEERREELALATGYQEFSGSTATRIPTVQEPGFADYHRFINHRMRELYLAARRCIPELAFEVRIDKDPVQNAEGGMDWLGNDHYADSDHLRCSYWAPFIGAANEGELLTAEQALGLLEYTLKEQTSDGGNSWQFIDQFNFVDDTFKYSGQHARIVEAEVPGFLSAASPLLKRYSMGIGIWAWRDYVHNCIFNPGFQLGLKGWDIERGRVDRIRCSQRGLQLQAGDEVGQSFWGMSHGLHRKYRTDYLFLEVSLDSAAPVVLEASLDAENYVALVAGERQHSYTAQLAIDNPVYGKRGALFRLRLQSGSACVSRVVLNQHSYQVGIRNLEGDPGPYLQPLRELNLSLSDRGPML